uniref:Uncharacterized protein n=1 Tax=Schistocephalus solidus TaxID=70667 RepID=A0A0X3PSZ4_SCHSO
MKGWSGILFQHPIVLVIGILDMCISQEVIRANNFMPSAINSTVYLLCKGGHLIPERCIFGFKWMILKHSYRIHDPEFPYQQGRHAGALAHACSINKMKRIYCVHVELGPVEQLKTCFLASSN